MPKFNLKPIVGNSYFIDGFLSIGVYVNQLKQAILFDSGIDKDTAKAVENALSEHDISIGAVINTHHHVDHIGGNQYLQTKNPSLPIYASKWESHFIETPTLETTCFNCGAEPHSGIAGHRHLQANPSKVTNILQFTDSVVDVLGAKLRVLPLPGHTQGMIGLLTPDNVFYCGDAFFGPETFSKHQVPLYTSISDALKSFDTINGLSFDQCVLYHGGTLSKDTTIKMVNLHKKRLLETANEIHKMIHAAKNSNLDALTQAVMRKFGLADDHVKWHLTKTTTNAYVTYLEQNKLINLRVKDGMLEYSSIAEPKEQHELEETEEQALSKSAQRVQDELQKKGFEFKVITLPDTAHRASDAAIAISKQGYECKVEQIVKSLLFVTRETKQPILVLAGGKNQVNERMIARLIGTEEKIDKADADFAKQITGFAIGGIPPVAHKTRITHVFIDEDLVNNNSNRDVWAAAGTPHAVFKLPATNLAELTGGRVVCTKELRDLNMTVMFNSSKATTSLQNSAMQPPANDDTNKQKLANR